MPHPNRVLYKHVSPLKMFEYMTSGRPIIASKLNAIEEILEDGRSAYLSKAGDAVDIARAIHEALLDSKNQKKLLMKPNEK